MVPDLFVKFARRIMRSVGQEPVAVSQLAVLETEALQGRKARLLGMMGDNELARALSLLESSESQINQDLWVLHELGWKRDGYFVEFGATNGRTLNNTWLLEREFGWRGILAEPGRTWHPELTASGRKSEVDFDCVWSKSNEQLIFSETPIAEFSTVSTFETSDSHVRDSANNYPVRTISLIDLLDRHKAPAIIDYLSIDTEGSEHEILAAFDFQRYRFRCISCEHNFTKNRGKIYDLLSSHGYVRKYTDLSLFDDWYFLDI